MIWTLFLAHFIGDYTLQSRKIVLAKRTLRGLLLHVSIHLLVLFALTWGIWPQVYPYLLLIGVVHFFVDLAKGYVYRHKPHWVIMPYLTDQVLHWLTIIVVWSLMDPSIVPPLAGPWQKTLLTIILISNVWFISERILFYKEQAYVDQVNQQAMLRPTARALLTGAFYLLLTGGVSGAALSAIWSFHIYSSKKYRMRSIFIDVCVGLFGALLLQVPY